MNMTRPTLAIAALAALAFAAPQSSSLTTFTNGSTADANQVNSNFTIVNDKAESASGAAAMAQADANVAQSAASAAQNTATSAQSAAAMAQSTADGAASAAAMAQSSVDGLLGAVTPQGSNLNTNGSINVDGNVNTPNFVSAGTVQANSLRLLPQGYVAPGAAEELRIVRGSVAADGSTLAGTGFVVTQIGSPPNEQFAITFNPPFSQPPTVVANISDATGFRLSYCSIAPVNGSQVNVAVISGADNDFAWRPFSFIAIGSR